jgi:hypothetical protein
MDRYPDCGGRAEVGLCYMSRAVFSSRRASRTDFISSPQADPPSSERSGRVVGRKGCSIRRHNKRCCITVNERLISGSKKLFVSIIMDLVHLEIVLMRDSVEPSVENSESIGPQWKYCPCLCLQVPGHGRNYGARENCCPVWSPYLPASFFWTIVEFDNHFDSDRGRRRFHGGKSGRRCWAYSRSDWRGSWCDGWCPCWRICGHMCWRLGGDVVVVVSFWWKSKVQGMTILKRITTCCKDLFCAVIQKSRDGNKGLPTFSRFKAIETTVGELNFVIITKFQTVKNLHLLSIWLRD